MRTPATPARATFSSALVWAMSTVMFLTIIAAVGPQAYDNIAARFGHPFVAPPAQIRTLAIPTYAPAPPPAASPEPPQQPLRENAAPAIVAPVSAPTMAPVAPVGIKVIVIKPADGSGPIVLRDGIKYRGRP